MWIELSSDSYKKEVINQRVLERVAPGGEFGPPDDLHHIFTWRRLGSAK